MPDTAERPATIAHEKYERLIKLAQSQPTIKAAIAHPCDDVSLQGAVEAARLRLIEPILVGPVERIRRVADACTDRHRCNGNCEFGTQPRLCREGGGAGDCRPGRGPDEGQPAHRRTDGAPWCRGRRGIRTARRISHCFIMDVPNHPEALIITDAAVNIAPTLDDKVDIVQNAIDLAHALGVHEVRVAILSAMETVNVEGAIHDRGCRAVQDGGSWPDHRGACWTDRSRSTTRSARRPRRSSRSYRRWRDGRTCSWFPTSKRGTCSPRACRSWQMPMPRGSCLGRASRSS